MGNKANRRSKRTNRPRISHRNKERRESKPHHKESKQARIKIDREVVVKVDQERLLADAVFKGYEDVVVQDIDFRTDNMKFRKEKYYSPGKRRTYQAELPAGYSG